MIYVEVWDTNGNERIYGNVNLIIGVFDISQPDTTTFLQCTSLIKGFYNLNKNFNLIFNLIFKEVLKQNLENKKISIMIVGNKIDINDGTVANESLIDDYISHFNANYFKTSACTLLGTDKLFDAIMNTIQLDSQFFIQQQMDKDANESLTDSMLNNTCDSLYRKILESDKFITSGECSKAKSHGVNYFNSIKLFLRKLFCLI